MYTGIAFRPQDAYASNSINLERKQGKSGSLRGGLRMQCAQRHLGDDECMRYRTDAHCGGGLGWSWNLLALLDRLLALLD